MMRLIDQNKVAKNIQPRIFRNSIYKYFFLAATTLCLLILAVSFYQSIMTRITIFRLAIFNKLPSRKPEKAGVYTAFIGTIWMMAVVSTSFFCFRCRYSNLFRRICKEK